jgi:predicted RNA methylase
MLIGLGSATCFFISDHSFVNRYRQLVSSDDITEYDRNNDNNNTNVLISRAWVTLADFILFSCTQKLLHYLADPPFGLWGYLIKDIRTRVVLTKLDIYVFITITRSIHLSRKCDMFLYIRPFVCKSIPTACFVRRHHLLEKLNIANDYTKWNSLENVMFIYVNHILGIINLKVLRSPPRLG